MWFEAMASSRALAAAQPSRAHELIMRMVAVAGWDAPLLCSCLAECSRTNVHKTSHGAAITRTAHWFAAGGGPLQYRTRLVKKHIAHGFLNWVLVNGLMRAGAYGRANCGDKECPGHRIDPSKERL